MWFRKRLLRRFRWEELDLWWLQEVIRLTYYTCAAVWRIAQWLCSVRSHFCGYLEPKSPINYFKEQIAVFSAACWVLLDKTFSNQIHEKCVSHLGQLYVQWLLDCAAFVFDNHILESVLLSQNFLSYSISCRCNFETGLCDLTQLANDTFNWRRQAGRTGSFGTGPSFDHTTESSNGKTWSLFIPLYTSQHPNMVKLKAWIFKRAETLLAL